MKGKMLLLLLVSCINIFADVSFDQEILYGKNINASQQIIYTAEENQGYLYLVENEKIMHKIKLKGVLAFKEINDSLFALTYNKLNGLCLEQYRIKNKRIERVNNTQLGKIQVLDYFETEPLFQELFLLDGSEIGYLYQDKKILSLRVYNVKSKNIKVLLNYNLNKKYNVNWMLSVFQSFKDFSKTDCHISGITSTATGETFYIEICDNSLEVKDINCQFDMVSNRNSKISVLYRKIDEISYGYLNEEFILKDKNILKNDVIEILDSRDNIFLFKKTPNTIQVEKPK